MPDLVERLRYLSQPDCRYIASRELYAEAADEIARLRAREDRLLRITIDATWGEALEDGSMPATKKQDWIIDYARKVIDDEQSEDK